jgi:hypothetical protein
MSFKLNIAAAAVERSDQLDEISSRMGVKMDEKAQQTGAVAGLFLAAAFGFLKTDDLTKFLDVNGHIAAYLLIGTITLFMMCLAACLSVAWRTKTPAPLSLQTLSSLNDPLLNLDDAALSEEVQKNYFLDQLRVWEVIIASRNEVNRKKGVRLLVAQTLLATGMFSIAVLLIRIRPCKRMDLHGRIRFNCCTCPQ